MPTLSLACSEETVVESIVDPAVDKLLFVVIEPIPIKIGSSSWGELSN
jgi:hypothetical protein